MQGDPTVPYGYCQCGCGGKTTISHRTVSAQGVRKGEPRRYLKGHQPTPPADLTRYCVDATTGCWIWQGALTAQGYGAARWDSHYSAAHRAVWLSQGREIPAGQHLHHECRNRACVNPEHLTLMDGVEHSTLHARGKATITVEDARAIRQRVAQTGESAAVIAAEYGVTRSAITALLRGQLWQEPGMVTLRRRAAHPPVSDEAKAEVLRRVAEGELQKSVAQDLGISRTHVSNLVNGKTGQKRRAISPASAAQREKVKTQVCAVCQSEPCDPAHLAPRAMGRGCDDRLCVIALCRTHHDAFDRGALDLLPHLSGMGFGPELAHMQGHYDDPMSVVIRLSGTRWVPEERAA